ncbi:MAG: DUF4272 domain-containing protein, partial [Sideroxyarcus sp.]|nr:DUF4272 domain-containing protein [Sideroxyarcus sp.]
MVSISNAAWHNARLYHAAISPNIIMSPEQRKQASELQLHKRGIRINVQLHVIESDEEVTLRSRDEVFQRLIALWAVSSAALARDCKRFRDYLDANQMTSFLSKQEQTFLSAAEPTEEQFKQFSSRQESLYFLAWCAGLTEKITLTAAPSNLKNIYKLFPHEAEAPSKLAVAIRLRRKDLIMDSSDLLYRLHWEVRHSQLTGRPCPASVNA